MCTVERHGCVPRKSRCYPASSNFPRSIASGGPVCQTFATTSDTIDFTIGADVAQAVKVDAELATLPRVEQVSDFHCVTD